MQSNPAQALIEGLKAQGTLHDPAVESALLTVRRHVFLPASVTMDAAYADQAIPLKRDRQGAVISSISQPSMIVQMLEQLLLQPGHNVLEVGTATGYNAALMQHIVGDDGRITSLEFDNDLVLLAESSLQRAQMGQITVVHGDGARGYAPRASYDRIIATAGVWDIPPAWKRQLKRDGILVTPIWLEAFQVCAAFRPATGTVDETLISDDNLPCWFVRLRGADAGPTLLVRIGSSSLELVSTAARQIDSAAVEALLRDDAEINHLDMQMTYWTLFGGLLLHLMMHPPADAILTAYAVTDDQMPYGIPQGTGFALTTPGSACFVSFNERGAVHCFGASDAFITVQDALTAWQAAGSPLIDKLRLRLTPVASGEPLITSGRLFKRRYHHIHAWLDT